MAPTATIDHDHAAAPPNAPAVVSTSRRGRGGLALLALGAVALAVWFAWRMSHPVWHPLAVLFLAAELSGAVGAVVVGVGLAGAASPRDVFEDEPRDSHWYAHAVADLVGRTRAADIHRDVRTAVRAAPRWRWRDRADATIAAILLDGPRRLAMLVIVVVGLMFGTTPFGTPPWWAIAALVVGSIAVGLAHVSLGQGRLRPGDRIRWSYGAIGEIVARVEPTAKDCILQTRAIVETGGREGASTGETAAVAVAAKGSYLRYLPALYERDELMARFLMLFESFWGPIEQRVEHMHLYFDPRMAPAEVLPWLASWLGLVLDEHWSEAQRRQLIASAASLYRKRGTPQGLIEYLSILGEEARIVEHRANNLVLGTEVKLGQSIALGTENVPHTFTVILRGSASSAADDAQIDLEFDARMRRIKAVIEAEKPAHTGYTVRFEADPDARHMEG